MYSISTLVTCLAVVLNVSDIWNHKNLSNRSSETPERLLRNTGMCWCRSKEVSLYKRVCESVWERTNFMAIYTSRHTCEIFLNIDSL